MSHHHILNALNEGSHAMGFSTLLFWTLTDNSLQIICTSTHLINRGMPTCSVAQSCPTLCDATDHNLPGSSVHGIYQARILGWFSISLSRDLPNPGLKPASLASPALTGGSFTTEPPGKLLLSLCVGMVGSVCPQAICDKSPVNFILKALGTDLEPWVFHFWWLCIILGNAEGVDWP